MKSCSTTLGSKDIFISIIKNDGEHVDYGQVEVLSLWFVVTFHLSIQLRPHGPRSSWRESS